MPGLSAVFYKLVPLWMLASSSMNKLVFMILVLHRTFAWVRSVLLLTGSSLCIYIEFCRLLWDIKRSQATVVISSVDVVSRLRVTFVCLISHGLRGKPQVVTALLVLSSPPYLYIA